MIACVRLPHFAAAHEEHEQPDLSQQCFVLVSGSPEKQTVVDASRQAVRTGIRAGMGIAQARAHCADLIVRPAIHSRYQQAFETVLEALTVFTAQVEPEDGLELRADGRQRRQVAFLHASQLDDYPAATCYLDLGKLKSDEIHGLARQLQRVVWDQHPIPIKLGLSSGKFPARVAATSVNVGDFLAIQTGREADFLSGFTSALLPVDGETLRQLDLLGWYTLGDVAVQPIAALMNRFGKQGRIMHRLANGRDTSPVQTYTPPVIVRASRQLAGGVADWGRLGAVIGDMVTDAVSNLHGQTVRHIALVLVLENGAARERQLVLHRPSGNAHHLGTTALDMAQSLDVSEGVVEIDLTLNDINPAVPRQLSLFGRPAVSQAHLNTVLNDLLAHYGEEHFFWVRATNRDDRLPERRYRWEKADQP